MDQDPQCNPRKSELRAPQSQVTKLYLKKKYHQTLDQTNLISPSLYVSIVGEDKSPIMIPITTTWKHAKVHALTMCPDAILSIFLRECTLLKWCFQWKYLVCVVLISCANFPLCVWTCWYLVLIQFTQYIYVYIEKISEYAYTWQSGCCGRSCESHDNADLIWICRKENPQKKKVRQMPIRVLHTRLRRRWDQALWLLHVQRTESEVHHPSSYCDHHHRCQPPHRLPPWGVLSSTDRLTSPLPTHTALPAVLWTLWRSGTEQLGCEPLNNGWDYT